NSYSFISLYHHYCYASIQFNINVYILGLHRSAFDHSNTSFDEHVEVDHNVWHYIYFIIYLRTKLTDDLTGLEIYIDKLIKDCQTLKVIICTFTLQRRMAMINIRC
ncbi:uncharacterized protein DC041_0011605, partial [Schistosoma bovis]